MRSLIPRWCSPTCARHSSPAPASASLIATATARDHGLKESIVREEVEHAGFRQVARYDFTKADGQDYFLIFVKQ